VEDLHLELHQLDYFFSLNLTLTVAEFTAEFVAAEFGMTGASWNFFSNHPTFENNTLKSNLPYF